MRRCLLLPATWQYTVPMPDPFGSPQERGDSRFASPEQELAFLRAQVEEKERRLRELEQRSNSAERKEVAAHETLQEYHATPNNDVLLEQYKMSPDEISLAALELPQDLDDEIVEELLLMTQEKGIKNTLAVVEELGSPHVEDDFHRALVQIVTRKKELVSINEKQPLYDELNVTLFEITLPDPGQQDAQRPMKELVSAMEQFYRGLYSMDPEAHKKQERHFTLEVAVSGEREDIVFYLAVPKEKEALFEKQLLASFPRARATPVPQDYNLFLHDGETVMAEAVFTKEAILPIIDYRDFDHDPISSLINAFTKISPVGEGAAVQVVINPVGGKYIERYRKVLKKLDEGMSLQKALQAVPEGIGGEVFNFMRDIVKDVSDKKDKDEFSHKERVDSSVIEQIRKKIETPIPAVNVRIVASAGDAERARAILADIKSSFSQFQNTLGNAVTFTDVPPKQLMHAAQQFTFRSFNPKKVLPLSLREISTIMHFPTQGVASTPQLKQARGSLAPAPIGLPTEGTLLGTNVFRGVETNAYLTELDRMRHLYVIGQTGVGKTVFMKNLINQDIAAGNGVCFIDPHGTDIEDVLAAVPEERMDDVIYFDPANTEHVMGLNMLEYDPNKPEQKTFVINELFSIFKKLYSHSPESMGPAFEQYFRNATALVMEDPATGNTMLDISRVMADAQYREVKLSRSKNPVVNQFWREIATKAQGEASLQNIVPYITNKFDIFTANDIMRPIIGQQTSSFHMRQVMDTRKILLVNLAKGRLGDINAHLLGMIIVGKILMAALARVDAPADSLAPFFLYIDEFQNVSTDSISAILSEARKYKLSLNIAHQYIAQLDEGIRDAVFGNVGSLAVFRVGAEDAEFLESQFKPVFETTDIMRIENYYAYVKLLARGVPQKPFSILVPPPQKGSPEKIAHIVARSQEQFTRKTADVDKEIRMRYGIGGDEAAEEELMRLKKPQPSPVQFPGGV
jgi:hypothetical protein